MHVKWITLTRSSGVEEIGKSSDVASSGETMVSILSMFASSSAQIAHRALLVRLGMFADGG